MNSPLTKRESQAYARYADAYPKAIELVANGSIDGAALVTDRYRFYDSVFAFEFALNPRSDICKIMIELE